MASKKSKPRPKKESAVPSEPKRGRGRPRKSPPKVLDTVESLDQLLEREQITEKEYNRRRRRIDGDWYPGGTQGILLDVVPDNAKDILAIAKRYKSAQRDRMEAGREEAKFKVDLGDAIRRSDMKADKDGKYEFTINGYKISLIPRDEVIKVVDNAGDESAPGGRDSDNIEL